MPKCTVCAEEADFLCPNCRKASYCSPKHQDLDKQFHSEICFPGRLVDGTPDENGGVQEDYLATREIQAAEKLFVEKPFLIGPGYNAVYFDPNFPVTNICLGCYEELDKNTCGKCSTCGMNMCKPKEVRRKRKRVLKKCEDESWHKDYECKLAKDLQIRLFDKITSPIVYYYITIIRLLLLKQTNPEFWQFLEEQFSWVRFCATSEKIKRAKMIASDIKKMFKGYEKKSGLPFENLMDAMAVIYRFQQTSELSSNMYCSALYTRTYMFAHSCSPNTGSFHRCTDVATMRMESIAFQHIPMSTRLTQSVELSLITLGTDRRQCKLEGIYEHRCDCTRCQDPTEFGTYFSGVKCVKFNCKGYLLPDREPIKTSSTKRLWKCSRCHMKKFMDIAGDLPSDRKDTRGSVRCTLHKTQELITETEQTIRCLKSQVHSNHYTIFHGYNALLSELCQWLTNCEGWKKVQFANKMISLCGQQFSTLNAILPGVSPIRGRLLFFFVQALRCFTTEEYIPIPRSPCGELIIQIQEKAKEDALKIFHSFPDCFDRTKFNTPTMIAILCEPDYFIPKYLFEEET